MTHYTQKSCDFFLVNGFHSVEFAQCACLLKICLPLSTQLCLSCRPYKRDRLRSVNILSTNKFLCSDGGETHTVRAAALSLHLRL